MLVPIRFRNAMRISPPASAQNQILHFVQNDDIANPDVQNVPAFILARLPPSREGPDCPIARPQAKLPACPMKR
jgi:hypothetical protein